MGFWGAVLGGDPGVTFGRFWAARKPMNIRFVLSRTDSGEVQRSAVRPPPSEDPFRGRQYRARPSATYTIK
jgi:hypothetical protein